MVTRFARADRVTDEVFQIEQWFDAPIADLWSCFTDAERLTEWHGGKAELDARPNGLWRCEYPDGAIIRGQFLELDAPHRLVYTWGFERQSERQLYEWAKPNFTPPGQSIVTVNFTESERGTRVRLRQSNFEPGEPLADGWTYFLSQLATLLNERSWSES